MSSLTFLCREGEIIFPCKLEGGTFSEYMTFCFSEYDLHSVFYCFYCNWSTISNNRIRNSCLLNVFLSQRMIPAFQPVGTHGQIMFFILFRLFIFFILVRDEKGEMQAADQGTKHTAPSHRPQVSLEEKNHERCNGSSCSGSCVDAMQRRCVRVKAGDFMGRLTPDSVTIELSDSDGDHADMHLLSVCRLAQMFTSCVRSRRAETTL